MDLQTHTEIERRAYHIWEREGRPHGRDFDHWLKAEQEMSKLGSMGPAKTTTRTAKEAKPKRATTRSRKIQ